MKCSRCNELLDENELATIKLDRACDRVRELEEVLKLAQEALFWHDGMAFEHEGKIVGQVITDVLK